MYHCCIDETLHSPQSHDSTELAEVSPLVGEAHVSDGSFIQRYNYWSAVIPLGTALIEWQRLATKVLDNHFPI